MPNITLNLNAQETLNTQIEIAIRTLAVRKATTNLMIELSTDSPKEKNRLLNKFAQLIEEYENDIIEGLYERRGTVNIDEIIK